MINSLIFIEFVNKFILINIKQIQNYISNQILLKYLLQQIYKIYEILLDVILEFLISIQSEKQ